MSLTPATSHHFPHRPFSRHSVVLIVFVAAVAAAVVGLLVVVTDNDAPSTGSVATSPPVTAAVSGSAGWELADLTFLHGAVWLESSATR